MNFRDLYSKRQFFFSLFLFVILIPMAMWDSGTQVKVTFDTESFFVKSDRYNMRVDYAAVVSADLSELAEPGEKLEDGFDDDILRIGTWKNDVWGEYKACIDPDTRNCVVLHLSDGQTFVFSSKNDKTTSEHYDQLLSHLR